MRTSKRYVKKLRNVKIIVGIYECNADASASVKQNFQKKIAMQCNAMRCMMC